MDTMLLWTELGVIHKDSYLTFSFVPTDDPTVLDVQVRPFRGSVSKVYHAEPATVTWYGGTMWRETTPSSDILYTVKNGSVRP